MYEKIQNVVLISFYNEKRPMENLGLGYISSYAKSKSINTQIINMPISKIDYNLVLDLNPCIIGIPIYNANKEEIVGFINEYCIRSREKVHFVLGSIYASANWKDLFSLSQYIDFVVVGEGEQTFIELIITIQNNKSFNNIKGLAYRKNDEIIYNGKRDYVQLNIIPAPERDATFAKKVLFPYIFSQRGCASNCSFCSINFFGGKVRSRTLKQFSEEVKQLYDLGYRHMAFLDPSLDSNSYEKMEEIAEELIRLNLGISYQAHFRANNIYKISNELIAKLRHSGLIIAAIGIESFIDSDLEVYNKKTTAQQNIDAINFFRRSNIGLDLNFMLYNSYSKFEDTYTNLEIFKSLGLAYKMFALFTSYKPYKGTGLYKKLADNNLLKKRTFDDYEPIYYDSRIQKLLDTYNNQIQPYFEPDNIFYFMGALFTSIFVDFRFRYPKEDNKIAHDIIDKIESGIQLILDDLSNKNSSWYLILLDAIKRNENTESIINSIKKNLTKEDLIVYKNKIYNKVFRLIQLLEKENIRYKEWRQILMKSLLYY